MDGDLQNHICMANDPEKAFAIKTKTKIHRKDTKARVKNTKRREGRGEKH